MKIILNLLRFYFQALSSISPRKAAKQAMGLFLRTQKNKIKPRELAFYQYSRPFIVESEVESLNCFEMGPKDGPIVFLVHGWNSRAGSMANIGFRLVKKGYRVIGIDLPGHGHSQLRKTDLPKMSIALRSVIEHIDPQEPISIVAHSFGSAITSFTLGQMDIEVDQLVYLTTLNKMKNLFEEQAVMLGLNSRAFTQLQHLFHQQFGQKMEYFNMRNFIGQISYQNLLIIHDKVDKVISYKTSSDFIEGLNDAQLEQIENVGHYRMLWNRNVIDRIADQFSGKVVRSNEELLLAAAF